MGFTIAIAVIPVEEIIQFHALIGTELGALTSSGQPEKPSPQDASAAHSEALSEPLPQPATGAPQPSDMPKRDSATPDIPLTDGGGKLQAPAIEPPVSRAPASQPNAMGIEKVPISSGGHAKRTAKKPKL